MDTNSLRDYYLSFSGLIDPSACQRLVNLLGAATLPQSQTKSVHLTVHTSGGSVGDGIFLYNFLRAFPFDLVTYNLGHVQSIGVVLFLGAKKRVVSPQATFMLHRASTSPQAATGRRLKTLSESIAMDDRNIEAILRKHLKMPDETWERLDYEDLFVSAEQAIEFGIADEIGEFSPPAGANVISVF